jgi:hypothetical protein
MRTHQFTFFPILISYTIPQALTLLIIRMLGSLIHDHPQCFYPWNESFVLIVTISITNTVIRSKKSFHLLLFYLLPNLQPFLCYPLAVNAIFP